MGFTGTVVIGLIVGALVLLFAVGKLRGKTPTA
jgi:hypothetical protein